MPEQLTLFDDDDACSYGRMLADIYEIRVNEAAKHPARNVMAESDFRDAYEAHVMVLPSTQRYKTLRTAYIAQEVRDETV